MDTETAAVELGGDVAVLRISDAALAKVLEIRGEEDDPDTLGLRIEVTGTQGIEFAYDLSFEAIAEAGADDLVVVSRDLTVMIPANSIDELRGSVLDVPSNPRQGGLVIRNPNRPDPLAGTGPLELTGDVPDRINQLLTGRINPMLAGHGGFASLVGIDGEVAYVSMGGGCQGCAASQLTMSEGIKKMILEAISEITDVVDATNHAAGENPFY